MWSVGTTHCDASIPASVCLRALSKKNDVTVPSQPQLTALQQCGLGLQQLTFNCDDNAWTSHDQTLIPHCLCQGIADDLHIGLKPSTGEMWATAAPRNYCRNGFLAVLVPGRKTGWTALPPMCPLPASLPALTGRPSAHADWWATGAVRKLYITGPIPPPQMETTISSPRSATSPSG